MASTDYDFILTRNELIEEAYRKVGVLADEQNITAGQLSTANKKLNLILKAWSEDGVKLWTQIVETATTVAEQNYLPMPDTNGLAYIESMQVREDENDRPLEKWSKRDYEQCPDKLAEGQLVAFYQDRSDNRIYFWPVPDEAFSLRIYGIKTLKDWEVESDTGELKARWQKAIKYALAVEIAEDYRLSIPEIQDLRSAADREYRLAMNKETVGSSMRRVKGAFE